MILGADKKKLSKRHGAVSTNAYRADGFLPEAILNFLLRLGWSHGDQEIFSIEEMIQYFDFDHVQKSGGVFNTEKLVWLNGHYIRASKPERLRDIVVDDYAHHFVAESLARAKTPLGVQLTALIQPKVKLVKEIAEQLVPLCTPGAVEVDAAGLKWGKDNSAKAAIQGAVRHVITELSKKIAVIGSKVRTGADSAWGTSPSLADVGLTHADVDRLLRQISEQHGVKLGELAGPMRLVVTGRSVSAGLFDLLPLLPWDVVEPRLKKVVE
jgi:glutamyl-tRNA synthetase